VGRILELNPEHPAVQAMNASVATDPAKAGDYAKLLYAQGCLMANLPIEDPMAYTRLVCSLMK
jgi:molecular chaperone HtpG